MKMAQAKMKNLASHRVLPVQGHSPGVAMDMRSGEDAAQAIAALEQQLSAAPNQTQALRIARRLTIAKRAAGQLAI